MTELKSISVDNLSIDPQQSRTSKESRVDQAFRNSIEKHGVINPLTVREKHTERTERVGKRGTRESPAGDQEYYIVAGRRRFHAAVEVGLLEIDCIVKDYTDEEAAAVSFEENDQRIDLSQFEIARAIKKRYDILAETLVSEDEEVECPECGKECKGRQGLKTHLQMKHEGWEDSSDPLFLGQRQIAKEIAESNSFDYKTVENLLTVANIPEQFQPFVKIHEERHPKESEKVEKILPKGFTFVNEDSNATVSQKVIDFARFANKHPPELVRLTLKRRDVHRKNTSELSELFRSVSEAWCEWEEEIGEDGVTETSAYYEALAGKTPPEEKKEPEIEEKTEPENTTEEKTQDEEPEKDKDEEEESQDIDREIFKEEKDKPENNIETYDERNNEPEDNKDQDGEDDREIIGEMFIDVAGEYRVSWNITEEFIESLVEKAEEKNITVEEVLKNGDWE